MCCPGGPITTTGQQINDLCTDPVNGCCSDNCQPKYPVNTTDVRVCDNIAITSGTHGTSGSWLFYVTIGETYSLEYISNSTIPQRFVVRANGECGTRLLDTGYLGKVQAILPIGSDKCGVNSAPCCTVGYGAMCTGTVGQLCPGR